MAVKKLNILPYIKAVSNLPQMLGKFFDGVGPYLGIYTYTRESLKRNQPAVGAGLVVTCISTCAEVEPFYLCFACLESFPQHFLEQHFNSRKHLINTLMYQNPWRLPFAWDCDLDDDALMLMAWEEEEQRENNEVILKVFDMPHTIFWSLDCFDYKQVLSKLQQYNTLLKRDVPPSETFSKLRQNEKFPLLGKQFLVNHDVIDNQEEPVMEVGSLCLLCERRLSDNEAQAHVFSREHVATFLDRFHPDSLDSSSVSAETLLDLAKQAARIHTFSNAQEIQLNEPIWEPCSYRKAIIILTAAKKRAGEGWLVPPITPKMRLVPRDTRKEVDQKQAKDSQKNSCDTDKQEKGKKKEEKSGENQMPMQREKEVETEEEVSPTACSEETQNPDETAEKPSREIATSFKNTGQDEGAQSVTKGSSSTKHVPAQLSDNPKKSDRKKLRCSSEKDGCPDEDVGIRRSPKRRRLTSKEDTPCEASLKMPNGGGRKENVAKGGKIHKDVLAKVSSTLLECHCANRDPVYLCWSCSLMISEKELVGHVARFNHQKMLKVTVNLDEKTYDNISKHSFQHAVNTLQALHRWPRSVEKPPSASPPSRAKPAKPEAALHAQHEASVTVVDIKKRDGSENCAAAAGDTSAVTKAIGKTTQVPSGSNKDQSRTRMKVPKSAGSSHTSLIDSCRSRDALRLNVPTCKAKTVKGRKADVSPSKTVDSSKIERTPTIEEMVAVSSISLATKSKCVTTSPKLTGSVSTVAKTTSATKSAAVSTPHGRGSGTASKVQVTSREAAPSSQTGHTVALKVNCRSAASSKMNDVPRHAAVKASVTPQTKVPSVITAKKPKTPVKHAKRDVSEAPHMKKSERANADVAANAPKRNPPPAAPHLSSAEPERSEHKKPHGKLPRVSTDKATASGNHFKVGKY
ncbi:uncharacterized protein [Leuresthes tenuis]|uniref:uncharacterized protein n=1 Tax=Leuresthes tenuis TaxID=355514 RepID=UPI003B505C87